LVRDDHKAAARAELEVAWRRAERLGHDGGAQPWWAVWRKLRRGGRGWQVGARGCAEWAGRRRARASGRVCVAVRVEVRVAVSMEVSVEVSGR
jgi:hypothetical protein